MTLVWTYKHIQSTLRWKRNIRHNLCIENVELKVTFLCRRIHEWKRSPLFLFHAFIVGYKLVLFSGLWSHIDFGIQGEKMTSNQGLSGCLVVVLLMSILIQTQAYPTLNDEVENHHHHSKGEQLLPLLKHRQTLQALNDILKIANLLEFQLKNSKVRKVDQNYHLQDQGNSGIEYEDFSDVVPFLQMASRVQEIHTPPSKRYREYLNLFIKGVNTRLYFMSVRLRDTIWSAVVKTEGKNLQLTGLQQRLDKKGKERAYWARYWVSESLCGLNRMEMFNMSLNVSVGIDIPDYISTGGKFDAIKDMSEKMKAMG